MLEPTVVEFFNKYIEKNKIESVLEFTNLDYKLFPEQKVEDEDTKVDFLFCNHIEELSDIAIRNISYLGQSGFIQTQSPLVEISRNTKSKFIFWTEMADNTLHLLPKNNNISFEGLGFDQQVEMYLKHSFYWNNYYFWSDVPKIILHNVTAKNDYLSLVSHAIHWSIIHTNDFYHKIVNNQIPVFVRIVPQPITQSVSISKEIPFTNTRWS